MRKRGRRARSTRRRAPRAAPSAETARRPRAGGSPHTHRGRTRAASARPTCNLHRPSPRPRPLAPPNPPGRARSPRRGRSGPTRRRSHPATRGRSSGRSRRRAAPTSVTSTAAGARNTKNQNTDAIDQANRPLARVVATRSPIRAAITGASTHQVSVHAKPAMIVTTARTNRIVSSSTSSGRERCRSGSEGPSNRERALGSTGAPSASRNPAAPFVSAPTISRRTQ